MLKFKKGRGHPKDKYKNPNTGTYLQMSGPQSTASRHDVSCTSS